MSLRVVLPGEPEAKEVIIPLPIANVASLRKTLSQQLGTSLQTQKFIITDTVKDITSDDDIRDVKDGSTWFVLSGENGLSAPTRERITFQPHPKTLTMAGDYEYFAAQGRHPFVYALAEFIDNSLRATRRNAPKPRKITISFTILGSGTSAPKGLICITDNGCGMTKHELNDWAVMNYSMEERGNAPQEPEVVNRGNGPGAGRFLSGDLSYFGVGSKNAAFFMGSCVKVTTHKAGERFVHELCLAADDLEERYRNQQAVYEEDMLHRNPGDPSTLAPMELPFGVAKEWVEQEKTVEEDDAGFTRVVVGNLKPEVLGQLIDDEQGQHICQELAHLYHYYLHGELGNRDAQSPPSKVLPNGEPLPDITLQYISESRTMWTRRLVEVDDDLETKMLRAQKSELPFTLDVPGKGTVCGVLYYFPYENDHETVPTENPSTSNIKPILSGAHAAPTQMPLGAGMLTQAPMPSQRDGSKDGASDEEDTDVVNWRTPIFEAFWQGRLIPGARIDSLPFIESVRQKRNAQTKDAVPDEVFGRLRGALFFGPAFKVTRNKLLFRDNLQQILTTAVPGDRNFEKKFREWLSRCHTNLDKSILFQGLADSKTQAALRSKQGENITAFNRITNGTITVSKGDFVKLNSKPMVLGRVAYFSIQKAVREEGAYANGRVHVEALPAEVYGSELTIHSLRRLDAVVEEKEVTEHVKKELSRIPGSLRLEPLSFNTGKAVEYSAGDDIPETSVAVLSGGGQKLTRATYGGKKQSIVVSQRLWKLSHEGASIPNPENDQQASNKQADGGDENVDERQAKKPRKGKKNKAAAQDEAMEDADAATKQAENGASTSEEAKLIFSADNKVPIKDAYWFSKLSSGLKEAGHYALEYIVSPPIPGQEALRLVVPLLVTAGPAICLDVGGEGRAILAVKPLMLGELLPPLFVRLTDEHGNCAPIPEGYADQVRISACVKNPSTGALEKSKELSLAGDVDTGQDGEIVVKNLKVLVHKRVTARTGMRLLKDSHATVKAEKMAETEASAVSLPIGDLFLIIKIKSDEVGLESDEISVKVRAGAPKVIALDPTAAWGKGASQDGVVKVNNGEELPAVKLIAFDAWGNRTAPSPGLGFSAVVKSAVLSSPVMEIPFAADGTALLQGLRAAVSTKDKEFDVISLDLKYDAHTEECEAAVELAEPSEKTDLKVRVLPSTCPAGIRVYHNGECLPHTETMTDEGLICTANLGDVEAGTEVKGLSASIIDEAGNLCTMDLSLKGSVAWLRKNKTVKWQGSVLPDQQPKLITLPAVKITQRAGEVESNYIRFHGNGLLSGQIECFLEFRVVSGAPKKWGVMLLEAPESQMQNPEAAAGEVHCGEEFILEIEALDEFNNRCANSDDAPLPEPEILLESDGHLRYDASQWDKGWVKVGNQDVYRVKMSVSGLPGPFKVTVKDGSSSNESSPRLREDSVTLELRAGPPVALMFDGPSTVRCSTRASLSLTVCCCDVAGNKIDPCSGSSAKDRLDVLLSGSALASDASGRAAKVSVKGGSSKARAAHGIARFADVLATAEAPGTYVLRAQSGSRRFALEDAVLTLIMEPQNVVKDLTVDIPGELKQRCIAGTSGSLYVAVTTEDCQPLSIDAAIAGLTLRVTPPGGNKSDVMLYNLPALEEGEPHNVLTDDGAFVFEVPELNASGVYSVVAEYSETRPELLAAMPKKEVNTRSATAQFTILPGDPVNLTLEVPSLPDRLTATNGNSCKQRTLLKNTAVQLRDQHGNPSTAAGLKVRFLLLAANQKRRQSASSGEVPILDATAAQDIVRGLNTDTSGRAFFGTLSLVENSGSAPSGRLECVLICQALGLSPSLVDEVDLELDEEGWATCWKCPVVFSDDAARFAALEQLTERRDALAARRSEAATRLETARSAVNGAMKEHQRAVRQAAAKLKAHPGAAPPQTVSEAERRVVQLNKALQEGSQKQDDDGDKHQEAGAPWSSRYGNPRNPITTAVDAALRGADAGLIGVFAQLGTVDDPRLARVASFAIRGLLSTLLVKDSDARTRIHDSLIQQQHAVPDIMVLSHVLPFRGPNKPMPIPGFDKAGPLAKSLFEAACAGTDGPLSMPLPHTRALSGPNAKPPPRGKLGPDDWPQGCLGFLVNLVRPVQRGQRATVLWPMLGHTLVFETLADASAYREYTSQVLRINPGDLLCLDMGRINGKGITAGSSFAPPELEKAEYLIGSGPGAAANTSSDGNGGAPLNTGDITNELTLLEGLIPALKAQEAAQQALEAAQARLQSEEEECKAELETLEGEIADVDHQLAEGNINHNAAAAAAHNDELLDGNNKNGGDTGKKRRRKSRGAAGGVDVVEEEAAAGEEEEQKGGKPKRKRLTKMK